MAHVSTKSLTSYDLFKSAALALMIVDHVGFFFLPGDPWLRVVGRLCVPIWFFFIGYARSRDIGPSMWAGMIVLLISDVLAGMALLPVNVLGSMLVIRVTIDPLMRFALARRWRFWAVMGVAAALAPFTFPVFEYGTEGYIMAVFGYLLRHRQKDADNDDLFIESFITLAIVSFVVLQWSIFGFDAAQTIGLAIGMFFVTFALYFFRPAELPRLTGATPAPAAALLRFTGRHTLFLYVAHILVFKALTVYYQPDRVHPLHVKFFSPTGF